MKAVPRPRTFLFLQGPPGPLFRRLGAAMTGCGVAVHRINICGGDDRDWPDGAVAFRGRLSEWPAFFDQFVRKHGITDLMLFGDCRPYHMSAYGIAQLRNIHTHVLEEGYIRPHWMTLEPDGVNARSKLSRDKAWFLREANRLPPEPELPPVTAAFRRRARDSYWYFHRVFVGRLRYPHYRSHRPTPILVEGVSWAWKLLRERRRAERAQKVLEGIAGKPNFVFPLQLSSDYQIRSHSMFADMQSAATYVIESFAANAPKGVHLILKSHPLDPSFFNWSKFIARLDKRLQLHGRLHFVDGGDLEAMLDNSLGLVCVNSTSATLALARGLPVCTVGQAIYDMPGLTHQGHLDSSWATPTPP
jgi:capsular polysaccharide export protein